MNGMLLDGKQMRRGEIRWCNLSASDKRCPVLILTRTSAIPVLTGIPVAPLTTTLRNADLQVFLSPEEDGVLAPCAVNLDNLLTVQKKQLDWLITTLSPMHIQEIDQAICFALGMDWVLRR